MSSILQQLIEIERNKTEFYVYEILVQLFALWLVLRKNVKVPMEKTENITGLCMQKILCYIEEHYAEETSLTDLTKSANISKSECAGCFRLSLNTAPYKYLTEFRLSRAAQLLKHTNDPIGNIAASVGFHQVSHFRKCFKEKPGCSPRKYRKERL